MVGAHNHLTIDHSASFVASLATPWFAATTVQAMMASPSTISDEAWFFDTGATHHLSQSVNPLSDVQPYMGNDKVIVGNVLHVPDIATNLISVSQFCADNNTFFEFHPRFFFVKDQVTKKILLQGSLEHGLYRFPARFVPSPTAFVSSSYDRASHPFALLHADLWGPTSIPSTTGARYFILFVDDFSHFSWIYPLHSKDQALSVFIKFKSLVENQFNSRIQCLRSDNGGEFKAFSSYLATHGRLYVTRHVVFHETVFPFQSTLDQSSSVVTIPTLALLPFSSPPMSSLPSHTTPSTSSPSLTNMPSSTTSLPDLIQVPFVDISTSKPHPTNQHPMVTRAKNGISKKKVYFSSHISEPTTFTQAVKDSNWVLAMEKEFSALQRNNTWHLVPPPSNGNIIGCKWVYKLKYKPDGTVDRYKARLVAQGFTQTLGLDYFETFSPIVKASTIRIILVVALSFNWSVHQLDVQNAFLHGTLEEHVFMHQPPGFINSQFPSHVCKLNKALYGLKQAPRHGIPNSALHFLAGDFKLLELTARCLFIIQHMIQHKYTQDLLSRTAMLESKPATTPGLLGQTLSHLNGEPLLDTTLYRSMSTSLDIHGYTGADWASCPDDRRSTGGYGIFLGPNLVSWSSNKQKVVSRSSAESEYRALASATSEIIWIQYVLQELCLSSFSPPLLWCDNKSAAHLAANPVFHARTKHIEMDLHFIRDHVLRKQLVIQYLPSAEQVADIFTKHISSSQFLSFRTKLSVVPSPVSLRGDDRRYLADQQESNCPGSAATNLDQVQQTKVSCNKQKPIKNVSKKEVS
ncbi:Retrovirus-related Pol polyprotein from transposon RE2 [Vitis vinifera]|uniref:Retrovirus-related Pol polyprotein from transposon RE2 n=1 Tax=Vitis vinifera TaxID=29760 RepID=A0A438CDB1_VITVI|nr:Retrovirus-related Pol polyprotein from transposon RE2 [Vitis vinifera]